MPHLDAPHEAPRPIVAVSDAIVFLQQHRKKYLAGRQGVGNIVPMAHEQVQELLKFLHTVERCVVATRFEAPDFWQVLAGQDDFRPQMSAAKKPSNSSRFMAPSPSDWRSSSSRRSNSLSVSRCERVSMRVRWSGLAGTRLHARLYLTASLHVPALAQEIRPSQPSVLKGGLNT